MDVFVVNQHKLNSYNDVEFILLPSDNGEMCVFDKHERMIVVLKDGNLKLKMFDTAKKDDKVVYIENGSIARVSENQCIIYCS